jgi:hypothetical protein
MVATKITRLIKPFMVKKLTFTRDKSSGDTIRCWTTRKARMRIKPK